MLTQKEESGSAPEKKRVAPSIKILAVVLAALLFGLAGIRLHAWMEQRDETRVIVLVNPWNDMESSGFTPRLKEVEGVEVDKSCAKALAQMAEDCRASGCAFTVTAGYRTQDEQLKLFNNEVTHQMSAGMNADIAYAIAEQRVGAPGCCEHELGLAVDIQGAAAQSWLRENAWRYGFILRYPEGSEAITGRSADPAHFRYVGTAAAEQIYSMNLTLEEYMGMFFTQEAEIIFE